MNQNNTQPIDGVKKYMRNADYTRTFHSLWGGTKIGTNTHALRQAAGRFYEYMSYELLFSNIVDILKNDDLEYEVASLPFGTKFTVLNEENGLTIFAGIDFDDETQFNQLFIYSIMVYGMQQENGLNSVVDTIFVEESNKGLFKIRKDKTVEINPPEIVFRTKQKKK